MTVQLQDANNNILGQAQTDANGYYEFEDLGPGQYRLFIDPALYPLSPQDQGGEDEFDSDFSSQGYSGLLIVSTASLAIDLDAGLL